MINTDFFKKEFILDSISNNGLDKENKKQIEYFSFDNEVSYIIEEIGGKSYVNGLIRIHTKSTSTFWTKICVDFFNQFLDIVNCFACDWLGRQYAKLMDQDIIIRLDPATGQFDELESSLKEFFTELIIEHKEGILNLDQFIDWQNTTGAKQIDFDECVGFTTPLMLGGEDEIWNLEVQDLEVYWELNYQLYLKIYDLPEGSLIGKIDIDD